MIFVIHSHDSPPAFPLLQTLNLPSSYTDIIKSMHWGMTDPEWVSTDFPTDAMSSANRGDSADGVDGDHKENDTEAIVPRTEKERSRHRKRRAAQEAVEAVRAEWTAGEFDAVLIAAPWDPLSVVKKVLPKLDGSSQIVVHSPTIVPLSTALHGMMAIPSVLNPTVIEPWLRVYQVLPGRTHPEMNGIGHGGFILHGTRILEDNRIASARGTAMAGGPQRGNKRRRR